MTHHTEQVGFPDIPINGTMKLRLRALAPTADSEVTGVVATQWLIYAYDLGTRPEDEVTPPYSLELGGGLP